MDDFSINNFKFYSGTNYYLDFQAFVFNLYLDPTGQMVTFYKDKVIRFLPRLQESFPDNLADLFAEVLLQVLKMDMGLLVKKYKTIFNDNIYTIAIEFIEEETTLKAVNLVSSWFRAMNDNSIYDFSAEFNKLCDFYNQSAFGDLTMYSLIEEGLKRNIPVQYNADEGEFQWGYGKKQLRGTNSTFHTDSYKDINFINNETECFKFLKTCGYPVPNLRNCFNEDEALIAAREIGFPVVMKAIKYDEQKLILNDLSSPEEISNAYFKIINEQKNCTVTYNEVIVQKQATGYEYKLLVVGGKYVAGQKLMPAHITGDGRSTIRDLIARENLKEERSDNPRSPMKKITVDEEVFEYLEKQGYSLYTVPEKGKIVSLRKISDIANGSVSIDITDEVHPKNIELVENIAKYWSVTCIGIDIVAGDIKTPWDETDFSILNLIPLPDIFSFMIPAKGKARNIPEIIMRYHFPDNSSGRVPLITGNKINPELCKKIYAGIQSEIKDLEFASLTDKGVSINGKFFINNENRLVNIRLLLRNPNLDIAILKHDSRDIMNWGCFHKGADVIILENPDKYESIMKRDTLPGTVIIEIDSAAINIKSEESGHEIIKYKDKTEKEDILVKRLIPIILQKLQLYENSD